MRNTGTRVAVGLSGGVDSSVAAALLPREGYDVLGLTMEIFDGAGAPGGGERHSCYGAGEKEDVESASTICEQLRIPFHTIDLRKEYREHVIDYFKKEYLAGRTPNPCVVCNRELKFGFLLRKAEESGVDFDYFATGHYARLVHKGGRFLLKKSADPLKDQTYFLYTLTNEQLSRTLFPVGAYTKQDVKEIARSLNFQSVHRPESQDFIAGDGYSSLFGQHEVKIGDIVDEKGNILGRHRGIIYYTVGQRRGLGVPFHQPLYVLKIDAERNRIVVGLKEALFAEGLIATDIRLFAVDELDRPYKVKAKIRLNHKETAATVAPYELGKVLIRFDEPQASVTPGQSVVLYSDDLVFGGGIIERALQAL
ncbi:MAG: tRNA 2-thiouridine(34) synthase MnmA [Deltaproteobacteria bacterium]|nr:tRNA 2-thiouridine(34) synthase MnmA [Deltaproteobacteria bacterium]